MIPGVAADPRDVFSRQFFPPFPWQCYRDLALVSRDGMNIVLNKINHILMEKYLKLQDTCRTQVRDPLLGAPVPSWDLLGWEWDQGRDLIPNFPCPAGLAAAGAGEERSAGG